MSKNYYRYSHSVRGHGCIHQCTNNELMLFTAAFRQQPSCQNYYREDRQLASFIAVYYLTQCFACYLYVTRALYSTSRNERTKETRRYQAAVTASRALRSRCDVPNTGVKQLCTKPQHSFAHVLFKMKKH
ncbi:Hypothetical_protein [Hexamita inflata]|uniref:Hypothetical_protein n=1 Tax=Hexamita inflata TaxID=28002 RepID=A0AA86PQD7_9EUKA|nr:Hypothetical protein HINF_LOCUS30027 [Hexamita inflata]